MYVEAQRIIPFNRGTFLPSVRHVRTNSYDCRRYYSLKVLLFAGCRVESNQLCYNHDDTVDLDLRCGRA